MNVLSKRHYNLHSETFGMLMALEKRFERLKGIFQMLCHWAQMVVKRKLWPDGGANRKVRTSAKSCEP